MWSRASRRSEASSASSTHHPNGWPVGTPSHLWTLGSPSAIPRSSAAARGSSVTKRAVLGREPMLYPLVYIASLALVALSSGALAVLGHDHVVDAAVEVGVRDDQAVVRGFVESNLTSADLESGSLPADRLAMIQLRLADLARQHGYTEIALLSPRQGRVLAAASDAGTAVAIAEGTRDAAAAGRAAAWVLPGAGDPNRSSTLVEAIPVVQGSDVRLVFQISRS